MNPLIRFEDFLGDKRKISKRSKARIFIPSILIGLFLSSFYNGGFGITVQAASPPPIAWDHTYNSSPADTVAYSVVQTSDGGYALAGTYYSYPYPPQGYYPMLVKTDSNGNMQWKKTYPGSGYGYDIVQSVVQTSDGGYVLAGYATAGALPSDIYSLLLKTDSAGNLLWSKTYTLIGENYAYSMVKTSDGGFALAGKVAVSDAWYALLLKTDSAGNFEWSSTFGSGVAYSVVQASDGGFALGGSFVSSSLLLKTDSSGSWQWSSPSPIPEALFAYSVVQTSDGGYAYAGDQRSLHVGNDIFLAKTDSNGNLKWNNTFGGDNDETCRSLVQTGDGGYALAGGTYSFGHGNYDFYLVKTDSVGAEEWWDVFGGSWADIAYSMIKTSDKSLALAGKKSGPNGSDMYLVKLGTLPLYHSVDIWTWDELDPNGWISEPITMDGVATGYSTPHHFAGLTGTHTFTVPATDSDGHPFSDWNTGWTDRTITVSSAGQYTARYRAGYSATIWSWDSISGWISEPITMDGVATGYSTPHTFAGLKGTHTFTVPPVDSAGHPFSDWSTGSTSQILTITSAGVYTARYRPATLTVTSPNGGEIWVRGTTHTITWTSAGNPGANVKIALLKAGVVNTVISSSTPNDGSYSWTIPSTQTLGTDYKIRITSTSNAAITDSSNSNFSIVAGTLTVTVPNGAESWKRGTVHTITWSKVGNPGAYVKIELLKGGVVNTVITSSTADSGSYSWKIPSTQTAGTDYKIRITSTTYSSISDSSNKNFQITT